jgi:hypothetical protein
MLREKCRRGAAASRSFRGARAASMTLCMISGCALMTAGCSSSGPPLLGAASLGAPTVAFDSIDGPPEIVFHKLVLQLTEEARARQVAVVSREEPAQYRVRGYLAAHVQRNRTTIAWVWDIYDAGRQRAMRLSGEVPGASPENKAWAAADDQAIGRMARDGMARLAAFLAAPSSAPDYPASPEEPAPNVAFAPATGNALAYFPPSRPHEAPARTRQ